MRHIRFSSCQSGHRLPLRASSRYSGSLVTPQQHNSPEDVTCAKSIFFLLLLMGIQPSVVVGDMADIWNFLCSFATAVVQRAESRAAFEKRRGVGTRERVNRTLQDGTKSGLDGVHGGRGRDSVIKRQARATMSYTCSVNYHLKEKSTARSHCPRERCLGGVS